MQQLTQDFIKEILNYNPETGVFTWMRPRPGKVKVGDIAGTVWSSPKCRTKYIYIGIRTFVGQKGKIYQAHRLAFLYMTGYMPNFVDHIDENDTNNAWNNLRSAEKSQNGANVRITNNNTSGYKGVTWDKSRNKWIAGIKYNYKRINLGRFDTAEEAAHAYDKKALELFGEFANLNFQQKLNPT